MIKHGAATREHRSPEWLSWRAMRQRCFDVNHSAYPNYGGRGIGVCKAWDSFEQFLADMGPRPSGKTLERRKNHLGYSATNCYWADASTQAKNRRPHRRLSNGTFAPREVNHATEVRTSG